MEVFNRILNKIIRIRGKYHSLILAGIDAVSIISCYALTWMMLMGRISLSEYRPVLLKSAVLFTLICLVVYHFFGMYRSVWRYAETREFFNCVLAIVLSVAIFVFCTMVFEFTPRLPISSFVLSGLLSGSVTLYYRMGYRLYRSNMNRAKAPQKKKRVMVVGTGESGAALIGELNRGKSNEYIVVCALDDDIGKVGKDILGVNVVGKVSDAVEVAHNYNVDIIILCMPSATNAEIRRAVSFCSKAKCQLKTIGTLADLVMGEKEVSSSIRDVKVEDLLGREVIDIGKNKYGYIKGQTVLVTGGGGSIGSELCRQIAASDPKKLIIVDIYENNAYEIQQELIRKYGDSLDLTVEISSVRDIKKMDLLFSRYKPNIVFHAAAHKHVPLMENVPEEAVKNNIYGTYNVAKCADKYGAKRFVLISTDKAVNPTNIMGATKRCCELVVQSMNKVSDTEFVAVRFGNVLGSNGSVIPLFKKQIAEGGPVTVTDPEIIRFFMTISEAVSLVLTAGEMAAGGEIFVLDMGDPVKILDLAENLIRLSGFEPYSDIDIKFTGLRPGEKLYEELLMGEEGLQKTPNRKIFIGSPLDIPEEKVFKFLEENKHFAEDNQSEKVMECLKELVPTFNHKENKHTV